RGRRRSRAAHLDPWPDPSGPVPRRAAPPGRRADAAATATRARARAGPGARGAADVGPRSQDKTTARARTRGRSRELTDAADGQRNSPLVHEAVAWAQAALYG